MKHIKINSVFCLVLLYSICCSSCASYLKYKATGDAKPGFNLAQNNSDKITVTCKGKELKSKLVYDGTKFSSPYSVSKFYLPKMYKKVDIQVTEGSKSKTVSLRRQRQRGWLWVEGVIPWMYEGFAGKLHYYNDVDMIKF